MNARNLLACVVIGASCSPAIAPMIAQPRPPPAKLGDFEIQHLPTGADITVRAAPGSRIFELDPHLNDPELRAGYAMSVALSPDGSTLALVTSGYNQLEDALPDGSSAITKNEYVFFYDVLTMRELQIVPLPNTFFGLAFATDARLYVSGGPDDSVHVLEKSAANVWSDARTIRLGHGSGLGLGQGPLASAIAITPSTARVVVANHENDSLSVLDERHNTVSEIELRPLGGVAGGGFPLGLAIVGESRAYVVAQRDRQLIEVDLDSAKVTRRLAGLSQPTRVIASRNGAWLYVAEANTDTVAVIDRARFVVVSRIAVGGSALIGASPNALALSADEKNLFVSLGGANAIAIATLDGLGSGKLDALVPTGFYPNDVALSRDGRTIFAAFGKSVAGPNPRGPWFDPAKAKDKATASKMGNQFSLQLMKGGLHVFPRPERDVAALLTKRALENEKLATPLAVPPIFAALRGVVKHVVYVVAENRTFDQILGDVTTLDGDATLVHWDASITPNQHALTARFSGFDRFFDSGGVSGDGWQWSTAARATDVAEKEMPLTYANRGRHTYDWEGKNRGVNVALPTAAARHAADPRTPDDDDDLLPGQADVAAVDRPREGGPGYLWDAAKANKLRVRNYGFFVDDRRYALPQKDPQRIDEIREPWLTKQRIAYPAALGLQDETDPYFRGFDCTFADFWRVREWQRELAEYEAAGDMPELVLVRLMRDHLGQFSQSLDGVDTPDTQMADHDYALGELVESLSRSRFWADTIVIAIEDDAQNGADHVDAHRSVMYFAGGHAARGVISHATYSTPSVLRTIELLLGLPPLARRDAAANPIAEALTTALDASIFEAKVPDVLRSTKLPLPAPKNNERAVAARGTAHSWARATEGMRFDHEDQLDAAAFNAILYCGLLKPSCAR